MPDAKKPKKAEPKHEDWVAAPEAAGPEDGRLLSEVEFGAFRELYNRRPNWLIRYTWAALIIVIVLIVAWLIVAKTQSFLTILLTALFISFALEPAVNWLQTRGWKRGWATTLVFFVFVALIGIFIPLLINLFIDEAKIIAKDLPKWLDELNDVFKKLGIEYKLSESSITDTVTKLNLGDVGSKVIGYASEFIGIIVRLFMILLFSIYFVADGPRMRRVICARLPAVHQRRVLDLWEISIDKTGGYFYSRAIVACVATVAVYVAMLIVSYIPDSHPEFRVVGIALAMFYGLTDAFIPIIGAYVGAIFPIVVVLIVGDWVGAIIVLAIILVYKQFEDYWLSPKVAAHTMEVHPAIAIGSVFAGAELLGITGALIALPVVAIIQAFLSTYLERHELIEDDLVSDGRVHVAISAKAKRSWGWLPTRWRRSADEASEGKGQGGVLLDDDEGEGPTSVLRQEAEKARDASPDTAGPDD